MIPTPVETISLYWAEWKIAYTKNESIMRKRVNLFNKLKKKKSKKGYKKVLNKYLKVVDACILLMYGRFYKYMPHGDKQMVRDPNNIENIINNAFELSIQNIEEN